MTPPLDLPREALLAAAAEVGVDRIGAMQSSGDVVRIWPDESAADPWVSRELKRYVPIHAANPTDFVLPRIYAARKSNEGDWVTQLVLSCPGGFVALVFDRLITRDEATHIEGVVRRHTESSMPGGGPA